MADSFKTKLRKMAESKLYITDTRMLKLIEMLKTSGQIKFRQDFLDVIDMPKQNFRKILEGDHHFTINHIARACKQYKVNANWLFGLEKKMFIE